MPIIPEVLNKDAVYVTVWHGKAPFADGYLVPEEEDVANFRLKCCEALESHGDAVTKLKPLLVSIPGGKA